MVKQKREREEMICRELNQLKKSRMSLRKKKGGDEVKETNDDFL